MLQAARGDDAVASGALAADAAALHPALAQPVPDARLHDVQRLPVSGRHRRRRCRLLHLRVDPAPSAAALQRRDVPLTTNSAGFGWALLMLQH